MLPNPAVRNKQNALHNQYAVLRWQVKNADLVLEDGIMPIVDYFRVFGNGRYLGKTKTMSFCLRKSREGDGRSGNRARGEEEDDERKAELDSLRSGRHDPARRAVKEAEACWAVVLLSLLENRSGSLGTKRALTKYPLQRE